MSDVYNDVKRWKKMEKVEKGGKRWKHVYLVALQERRNLIRKDKTKKSKYWLCRNNQK